MNSYDIIVTPDAEAEISELAEYISVNLGVPEVALNYIQCIRREIKKLSYMADSIAPETREPWHSKGLRKIIAQNFYVYYRIDDASGNVYILSVIYVRRDQLRALKNMNLYE